MENQGNDSKRTGKDVSQIKELSSSSPYVLSIGTQFSMYPPLDNSEIHRESKESGVTFDL